MHTVLTVEGLSKRYGGVVVADGISMTLGMGECLGILGPNGAGKTSLFNMLDGAVRPDAGRILLEGQDVTSLSPHRRARLGIARAFQIPQPFPALSVFENVLTSATFAAGLSGRGAADLAREAMERAGLGQKANLPAASLPLLDRKRLELARAVAAKPKLLLLDEIAGGLTEPEVKLLIKLVNEIKPDHAVIWIEHIYHALESVADSVLVLDFGQVIATGEPAQVLASPRVQEVYMGMAVDGTA